MKFEAWECIEYGDVPATCDGEVSFYSALSGSGLSYPRCEKHYDEYVERVQPKIDEVDIRYPDSPFAPAWFDPSYAGEQWDSDY